ncbi:MAG TPA: DPP IV N-terminal domain-containing protein [Mycobacteriales bacterium]|nr:DPP IV N-terminal domain-containing protein [Mycobacteriales bacterium]
MTDLAARYATAEGLLPHKLKALVDSPKVTPNWIRDTDTFWYANRTSAGVEYVYVDAAGKIKQPAFDHDRMAKALSGVLELPVEPGAMAISSIDFVDGAVRVDCLLQRVEVSLDTYDAKVLGPSYEYETRSPDGKWAAGVKDHNLYVRNLETDEVRDLTTDGVEGCDYAGFADQVSAIVSRENLGFQMPAFVLWSPDSTRFVTYRLDQRDVLLMHLVRSAPLDGGRPKVLTYHYALVGDPDETLATSQYFVFEAATGKVTEARHEPFLTPFVSPIAYNHVWWSEDSAKVFIVSSDRGDHTYWLDEMDAESGDCRLVLEESSKSHITLGPQHQLRECRTLSTGEVLWWSQRNDWAHLYLYAPDGTVRQLTSGSWSTRHVVTVDEAARRVVFTAAGRLPGSDLYLQELCSVSLDGGDVTTITEDGLDHDPMASPTDRYFVDVASRWDTPAISVLRDSSGALVMELEQADASALYAHGWSAPERVVVKAADGETDLYCSIYKPYDFDPTACYPVVNEVYPGPQISTTLLRFPLSDGPLLVADKHLAMFAALGFVGVAIDSRGTALREKSFQDHARAVRDGDNIDDHVAAIKQLAQVRPWMDLDKVGIFGHSGGAYMSTRAMLKRPDFFKVAVSSSGDHDDRINHAWWGEKFFGLEGDFDYVEHANPTHAANLEGKLLLIHGEMDDNATPHGTMRMVKALIEANKDFDLLIMPNAEHSLTLNRAYFIRRRWDYFVKHLMGETPPEYCVGFIPPG